MQQPLGRAIAHIDMDAFYAQVEVKQHPQLRGQPVGVVQYNPFGDLATHAADEDRIVPNSNGSLIAVSYEARAAGVKRNMRGDAARGACPEIQLVPTAHGKADLTNYRSEGSKVLDILGRMGKTERASIDEAYVDLTAEAHRRLEESGGVPQLPTNPEQVHVMQEAGFEGAAAWWQRPPEAWRPGERLLACAAAAVADLRAAVAAELGYTCSAGVAHTKLMAKLCSGLHKPAQHTVLPAEAVPALLGPLSIPKLRGLGGKMGEQVMSELGIETVGQLAATPLPRLEAAFGEKEAQWLYGLARGVTDDPVEERKLPKSLNCGKTFRGRQALRDLEDVKKWLLELGGELAERLEVERQENGRIPQLLSTNFSASLPWQALPGGGGQAVPDYHSNSRSCPLRKWNDPGAIAEDALAQVRRWAAEQGSGWQIMSLFITASNFVPVQSAASAITRFFKPAGAAGQAGAAAGDAAGEAASEQQQQQEQQQQSGGASAKQQEQQQQAGSRGVGRQLQQQQQQQPPSPPRAATGAAGPSGSRAAVQAPPPGLYQQQPVDESVLAELPPELQKEIRAQMEAERLGAHFQKARPQGAGGGGAGGKKAGGGGGKRPGSSSSGGGQPTIDAFLKGKRPKR